MGPSTNETTEYAHHPTVEIGWSSNASLEEDQAIIGDLFAAVHDVMKAHNADRNLYMNGTLRPHDSEIVHNQRRQPMSDPVKQTDSEALDQIAGLLGLYNTDPSNNPKDELIAAVDGNVKMTGRRTDIPEGA